MSVGGECSTFIVLHVAVQFSQHHLLKRLSFLHCIVLPPLWLGDHRCVGLSLGFVSCYNDLYFRFCASTIGSWLLYLCSTVWSQGTCPPTLFFFLKIALAMHDLLCFHTNCKHFCSKSVKKKKMPLVILSSFSFFPPQSFTFSFSQSPLPQSRSGLFPLLFSNIKSVAKMNNSFP